MLSINFVKDFEDAPSDTIRDVECEFARRSFNPDEHDVQLINMIEGASVHGSGCLIDRFGIRFFSDGLSTGCKAALLVKPGGPPVSLEECGYNAIHFIVNYCSGTVVTRQPQGDYMDYLVRPEPVFLVNGVTLNGVEALNNYMDSAEYED